MTITQMPAGYYRQFVADEAPDNSAGNTRRRQPDMKIGTVHTASDMNTDTVRRQPDTKTGTAHTASDMNTDNARTVLVLMDAGDRGILG